MRKPRSPTGQAIRVERRTTEETLHLDRLLAEADRGGRLDEWKRARAVSWYLEGRRVESIRRDLGIVRGTVNDWLRVYDTQGAEGLRTGKPPGSAPRLDASRRKELGAIIDAGPLASGFATGLWTGPMIREVIRDRFGVTYHAHSVPRLLHDLGFSVQRPRKRLARADHEAQAAWLDVRLPEIKKKRRSATES